MQLIMFFVIIIAIVNLAPLIPLWFFEGLLTLIGIGFVLGVIAFILNL